MQLVTEQISKQLLNQMSNLKVNGFKVEQKESTSNKHFYFSIIKSLTRIVGFLFLCSNMLATAGLILVFAEFLGILEEF